MFFGQKIFSITGSEEGKTVYIFGIKIKIKNRINTKPYHDRINQDIKKYKYIHIMFNDKFNKPFVDFLNKYFNPDEHMVICKRVYYNSKAQPFPEGKNVYEYFDLNKINLKESNIEKIIWHSLFVPHSVSFLYKNKELLKKSYWTIWGGDLYNAKRNKKHDYVRKKFKGYLGAMDKEVAIERYGMEGPFYNLHYPFPTIIENAEVQKKENIQKRIQINNSSDYSTLEVLDNLVKFKDENIKITTILSYGNMKYKEQIIEKGTNLFGSKFEYINEYMDSEQYRNYVNSNDILVLNQNRQQGVGNVILNIQLGNKVFIRSDVATYKFLNEQENVKIFDTKTISDLSFEDLIKNDYSEQNQKNIKNLTDLNILAASWRDFFNTK